MTNTPAPARTFAALSLLEKKFPPLRYGREPYWRAPLPGPAGRCYVPAWEWHKPLQPADGTQLLDLDVNGAWLGAISSVEIAHNRLFHTGAMWFETKRDIIPGLYRITNFPWALESAIVSPLGNADIARDEETLWIAHPTLILLWELMDEGIGIHFDVIDSWTARNPETGHLHRASFKKWYEELKRYRTRFLDAVNVEHLFPDGAPADCRCPACADYAAFKTGYASAVSMMLTGEKCRTYREDWARAIQAEFAASCWRKAWRYGSSGRSVLAMAEVDELTVVAEEFNGALNAAKMPFRYDQSGRNMGAFKVKRTYPYTPED